MWSEGTIRIPDAKDKGKNTVCHYWVKHYEEPSETYGINGGRISKLMIKVDGVITANYDKGWDVEPAEDDMPTRMAYCTCWKTTTESGNSRRAEPQGSVSRIER